MSEQPGPSLPSGGQTSSELTQVLSVLRTAKLIGLLVVGPILGAGGVVSGYAVAAMGRESGLALGTVAGMLASHPWWGLLVGAPVLACGVIGLKDRRRAWLWAALGTIATAAAVLALGVVVMGTLADVYGSLAG